MPNEVSPLSREVLERLKAKERSTLPSTSKDCRICGMETPNSGPYCTVCVWTFGTSRDGYRP
jgi:hypothetical protein